MTYDEWMALSEEEKDNLCNKSIINIDKALRDSERKRYFLKENLEKLQMEVEEWKVWRKLHGI